MKLIPIILFLYELMYIPNVECEGTQWYDLVLYKADRRLRVGGLALVRLRPKLRNLETRSIHTYNPVQFSNSSNSCVRYSLKLALIISSDMISLNRGLYD